MKGESYQEKIITFLSQQTQPTDIEKIKNSCGIGNWNTALTHCLQLLVQGKIQGQKTSKGWIFWMQQPKTKLRPWEEIIATFEDLQTTDESVTIKLSTKKEITISYPKNSRESEIITQTLTKIPKGSRIAILATNNQERPLLIKPLTKPQNRSNFFVRHWWFVQVCYGLRSNCLRSILRYGIWDCVKNGVF